MGNAAQIIGAFREMIGAKNISKEDLHDLIKDGIMAALGRRYGPNVGAEVIIDEEGGDRFGSSGERSDQSRNCRPRLEDGAGFGRGKL